MFNLILDYWPAPIPQPRKFIKYPFHVSKSLVPLDNSTEHWCNKINNSNNSNNEVKETESKKVKIRE